MLEKKCCTIPFTPYCIVLRSSILPPAVISTSLSGLWLQFKVITSALKTDGSEDHLNTPHTTADLLPQGIGEFLDLYIRDVCHKYVGIFTKSGTPRAPPGLGTPCFVKTKLWVILHFRTLGTFIVGIRVDPPQFDPQNE